MQNTNYPIGDFLIRLKNAAKVSKGELTVKKTKYILSMAQALKKEGYIRSVDIVGDNLEIKLAFKSKMPILTDLKIVSKPGLRVYMSVDEIQKQKGPFLLMVSTPIGIISSREALKKNIGGEVIAKIW
jgi:small subunit ribosomal protein S8